MRWRWKHGEKDYQVNNQVCELRDTDTVMLFLDSATKFQEVFGSNEA